MGLQWIRLDTSLPDHPKILELMEEPGGREAGFVYLCSMAYCGKHETDGFISRSALTRVNGRAKDARLLVKARLWVEQPGGWQVHGWDDYQISTDDAKARRKRAQAAAAARWAGHEKAG